MTVIVKELGTFNVIQLENVTNISYADHEYVITHDDVVNTYADSAYRIYLI